MIGTLDKKRGIVNVLIYRSGRKTYLSMDQALVTLGVEIFEGDGKALSKWIQQRVDQLDAQLQQAALHSELGEQAVQVSGFSRLMQRELIELARERLAQMRAIRSQEMALEV